jgi:phosphatidylglycerophosphate synthase
MSDRAMPSIKPPEYKADDRSLLLPYYKRFCVDPFLPLIPARMHPNTITHLGHLFMAIGAAVLLIARPTGGWLFAVTFALLWLYVFCDNADGAHARRTKQTSPLGEFLDHGLDLFNCVYIGAASAYSIGADDRTWILMGFMVPAACAAVYWEQANTGIFRTGLCSQIESSALFSSALIINTFYNYTFFTKPIVWGICLRDVIMVYTFSSVIWGIVRGIYVVGITGLGKLSPIVSLLALNVALLLAHLVGGVGVLPLVIIGNFSNCAFGLRMLSFRLRREKPRVDLLFCLATIAVVVAMIFRLEAKYLVALTITACILFTLEGALATTRTLRHLNAVAT